MTRGCQEAAGEIPLMTRSCGRDLTSKVDQDLRDPLDLLEHLPLNQNLSVLLFCKDLCPAAPSAFGLSNVCLYRGPGWPPTAVSAVLITTYTALVPSESFLTVSIKYT